MHRADNREKQKKTAKKLDCGANESFLKLILPFINHYVTKGEAFVVHTVALDA